MEPSEKYYNETYEIHLINDSEKHIRKIECYSDQHIFYNKSAMQELTTDPGWAMVFFQIEKT